MPWWQSAFSSSKSHSNDSLLGGKNTLKSAIFSRRNNRQLTRAKKLRHLSDDEVELWRSPTTFEQHHPSAARTKSSNAAVRPSPQPLPLPELQLLLRRDAKSLSSTSCNVPLPSPRDVISHQLERERARERPTEVLNGVGDVNSANGAGRLASQEARRSTEHSETRSARRSPQPMNGTEKLPDNNGFHGPVSAPTSPYSSPHRGLGDTFPPPYVSPSACFQVWSAPEMPSSESTISMEKTAYSVDNSPQHSPRISPCRSAKSPREPTSPLPSKLPAESSLARRESVPQANVHPLPLPPGATPLQPAPVPLHAPIPEVMPVKSRWQKGKLIGRGTFGSVYVASNRETGALCAMKEVEILPEDTKSAESIKQLEQEIKVLSNLKHPNIVQYYGSEIVGDRFYIYLEYVHPGSITKFIKDHCGAITESVVRNFTRHILCGLAYLHSTKTIHRDIKGANLLVDAFGVVKLADFGMAKHLSGHRENLSLKGSPYWMAPELLQSVMHEGSTSGIALAVDIWSLGCTIVEMLSGRPPWSEYEGVAAMFKVLKENPPIPDNLSEEGRDFLNCCFKRNPAERPSASMLLEHRFVKGPHQPDVPSSSGMKLAETVHSQREHPSNKVEQVPLFYDTQSIKGKLVDNESGRRYHHEASNLLMVCNLSPRSTLEALPGLSPPHSGY